MLKKSLIICTLAFCNASFCFAQASAPVAPAENTHQAYDKKVRACKQQATDQQLQGEDFRAFVAQCAKQP